MKKELARLPQEFLNNLSVIFPSYYLPRVWKSLKEEKLTVFRVNTLKISAKLATELLKKKGFRLRRLTPIPGVFILEGGTLRQLEKTSLYEEGKIYVQNPSSMLPPIVLSPLPGERVLDLGAAPGSKTTQMAALMRNCGKIVAIEKSKVRFYKLLFNLKKQGVEIVEPILADGTRIIKKWEENFDKVLVDAPCTAEGRFNVHKPRTYSYWKEKKIQEMVRKQKRLLWAGVYYLKKGGLLVYSTCTFSPMENEGVIQWLLEKFGERLKLEDVKLPPSIPYMEGLTEWRGKKFFPQLRKCVRIIPDRIWEGFFLAKLRKT